MATEQNKQRAIEAVNALRTILPYVMVFNERLEKVTVTDLKGDIATYVKDENDIIGQSYCSRTIHINDELKQINYLKSDKLTIVLPLRQLKDELPYTLEAEYLPDTLPKLFLFYPLIGTEDFGFNFVIHSKNFQPTEPRDGLHLNSENEKNKVEEDANQLLLEEGSQLIFDFLENNLESIRDPHYLASINFTVESDDNELNQYFSVFKEKWIAKFRKLPLVQTTTNRIAAENAIFLSNEILDNASKDTLQAIYRIIEKFYTNIPHQNLIPIWTQLVDEWRISDISRIGFSDIAKIIHNEGSLTNFSKEDLILLYKEILVKGHEGLFSTLAILPNIKGNLRKQIELSKTVELTKELIEIADLINPEISTRQVASDFLFNGLEFEPFGRKKYMELINSSLTAHLKDNTKSYELPQGYLQGLMQYSSITSKEGSTSGLIQIIKLIAQYYNLPFTQVILPSLPGDENIDVRKGQFDFFKLYLNDISEKDSDWVKENVVELSDILHQAFKLVDVKKYFLKYDVFPNQLFQLRAINDLNRDNGIPDFIKELYDKVVDSDGNIKSKLVHPEFQDLHDEMKPTNSLDLTRKIEQVFLGRVRMIFVWKITHLGQILSK
ncbi:MAG: hypothetical protein M0D57_08480 [Sphingobacteriales bacterium JAD_PAG50586_3]|nr:MAG: hypothetical protein M0D57_08480 [Sphingobacteriales bacterium JAD_PAG50586_3]